MNFESRTCLSETLDRLGETRALRASSIKVDARAVDAQGSSTLGASRSTNRPMHPMKAGFRSVIAARCMVAAVLVLCGCLDLKMPPNRTLDGAVGLVGPDSVLANGGADGTAQGAGGAAGSVLGGDLGAGGEAKADVEAVGEGPDPGAGNGGTPDTIDAAGGASGAGGDDAGSAVEDGPDGAGGGAIDAALSSGGTSGGWDAAGGAGGATDTRAGTGGAPPVNCASPVAPANGASHTSGLVTDFTDWNATASTWGRSSGVSGTLFGYAGDGANMSTPSVGGSPMGLHLAGTIPGRGYGGGGLQFSTCATAAAYHQLQFNYYGSAKGCDVMVLIQTFDQATGHGGCNLDAGACYGFPAFTTIVDASTAITSPATVTRSLSDFRRPGGSAWSASDAAQVVGIQWQFTATPQASDAPVNCVVDFTITSVAFLP